MSRSSLVVVGLGPAGLADTPPRTLAALRDDSRQVIVRTLDHPASAELAMERSVTSCDDLYDDGDDLETVYAAITEAVLDAARSGPTVYAVPGAPEVGERSVAAILAAADAAGVTVEVVPGGSFVELVWSRVGVDPIIRGAQILDGRSLPDPLPLHLPTLITQVDRPVVLADVLATLGKVLPDAVEIVVLDRLGDADEVVASMSMQDAMRYGVGPRTSLFVDPPLVGWHGLVVTNRRLRSECPWDRKQTHHTLLRHLIEETYETVEALSALSGDAPSGEIDHVAYAHVEEELGDLLLQVVFHATLAREAGLFDVEEVAETIRRKLVYRHPHVFGDVEAADAATVLANWEVLKAEEKRRESLMDDVPTALPAQARADKLQRRAASVGFDWPELAPVLAKLDEEVAEVRAAVGDGDGDAVTHEIGDVLFSVVNLSRHLGVDTELALRRANDRFDERFRRVEQAAATSGRDLSSMSLDEMDELWDAAKRGHDHGP